MSVSLRNIKTQVRVSCLFHSITVVQIVSVSKSRNHGVIGISQSLTQRDKDLDDIK